jgi:hypothetical protein
MVRSLTPLLKGLKSNLKVVGVYFCMVAMTFYHLFNQPTRMTTRRMTIWYTAFMTVICALAWPLRMLVHEMLTVEWLLPDEVWSGLADACTPVQIMANILNMLQFLASDALLVWSTCFRSRMPLNAVIIRFIVYIYSSRQTGKLHQVSSSSGSVVLVRHMYTPIASFVVLTRSRYHHIQARRLRHSRQLRSRLNPQRPIFCSVLSIADRYILHDHVQALAG